LPEIAEKVGANGYIRKPFDVQNFKNKVLEYLE